MPKCMIHLLMLFIKLYMLYWNGRYVLTRKCVHLRENTQITSLHAEKCFELADWKRMTDHSKDLIWRTCWTSFSIVAFDIFSIVASISYPGKTLFTHSPKAGVNWWFDDRDTAAQALPDLWQCRAPGWEFLRWALRIQVQVSSKKATAFIRGIYCNNGTGFVLAFNS